MTASVQTHFSDEGEKAERGRVKKNKRELRTPVLKIQRASSPPSFFAAAAFESARPTPKAPARPPKRFPLASSQTE